MRMLCLLGLVAACGGGGGFPDARVIDAAVPTATFTLAWTVDDTSSQPQPVACDPIGALSVTVLAHNRAFDGGTTVVFTCSTGMGQSQTLPEGTWDFEFQLSSATGVLATAPGQHGVVLTSGQNTALTPITFSVDATGGLALTLATNSGGGNCASQPSGGGIANTTITLVHSSDGTCAPLTFMISGGGTYTVNCTTPVQAGCIDSTQTLTVPSAPADGYTIHVRGILAGGATCWSNNDSLQVPPQGATLTKTLNLAYATGTTGC